MTADGATKPLVLGVLARVPVDDIDAALPLYVDLSDGAEPHRFEAGDVHLAWIGSYLLIEGGDDEVRSRAATVLVSDAAAVGSIVSGSGGTVLDGPAEGPNGSRLVARHPDGVVVEYVEAPPRTT